MKFKSCNMIVPFPTVDIFSFSNLAQKYEICCKKKPHCYFPEWVKQIKQGNNNKTKGNTVCTKKKRKTKKRITPLIKFEE